MRLIYNLYSMQASQSNYQVQSSVLFIVFNRPDTTQQVFSRIRDARPMHLYIAADGPRMGVAEDKALCLQVRGIAQQVDWPCEVKTLFRDNNLGCKDAVSSAINWFFEQEEEGVILEDDCLPAHSFFAFCDEMLAKYRYDNRIRHITGCNLQMGETRGGASYYFSNLTHVWGWASWRRVWQQYDKTLSRYQSFETRFQMEQIFTDPLIIDSWEYIFEKLKAGEIDTWDYQLTFINFFNNGLSIIPNQNLISNIGFGVSATHTASSASKYANIPLCELGDITHPLYILPQKQADHFILEYEFNLKALYKKHNKLSRRLKRWLKSFNK
ncbi:nucleotide-diphospho-sugar transferase [Mucilaginibacter galii]|uniref:Hemolytic protein HlpA n=2 Tax=Mucilaginibacter galii TaxID=2005073 RepID=A0A917JC79_9SPHI|nr:hemolytic protein HlpA [Mucilaginibacter galii]